MAPDANQTWYAAMRELGVEPGSHPLSDDEAAAEYAASPDEAADEGADVSGDDAGPAGESGIAKPRRGALLSRSTGATRRTRGGSATHRRPARVGPSPRWLRVAALLLAAGVLGAIAWNVVHRDRGDLGDLGGGGAGLPGQPAKQVAVGPDSKDPPVVFPDDPPDDPPAVLTLPPDPYTPTPQGTYYLDGRFVSREEAEKHFSSLESPYRSRGGHVDLFTDVGIDFGDRMRIAAEEAYQRCYQFFGREPVLPEGERMPVFVVRNTEEYNELGAVWMGDEKSSAFYAFTTPWTTSWEKPDLVPEYAPPFDIASVTLFSQAESLTEVYVTHAVSEQFVRRLIGATAAESPPRWFIDAVACYLGRWKSDTLSPWSRNRWVSFGGAPLLSDYFREYSPKEPSILTGGALIRFIRSNACPASLAERFEAARYALNRGEGLGEAFGSLEEAAVAAESDFRAYYGL